MSKVIRDHIGFALLRSVIGPENLRPSLNQSKAKLKPIMTQSPKCSRAVGSLVVFIWSFHWFLRYFPLLLLAVIITLVLVSRHSIEMRAYQGKQMQKFIP